MVRHQEEGRSFWTLPGGGIEAGESHAQAAERELLEETGVKADAVKLLWVNSVGSESTEYCYLMEAVEAAETAETVVEIAIRIGEDPEEAHLPPEARQLQDVGWRLLDDMRHDCQVAAVLLALY
jgi:8-oxo-dGTP diphosphatase